MGPNGSHSCPTADPFWRNPPKRTDFERFFQKGLILENFSKNDKFSMDAQISWGGVGRLCEAPTVLKTSSAVCTSWIIPSCSCLHKKRMPKYHRYMLKAHSSCRQKYTEVWQHCTLIIRHLHKRTTSIWYLRLYPLGPMDV